MRHSLAPLGSRGGSPKVGFDDVSLVDFAEPWANQEQTVFVDLDDYTLTVIGMIRDGIPFR